VGPVLGDGVVDDAHHGIERRGDRRLFGDAPAEIALLFLEVVLHDQLEIGVGNALHAYAAGAELPPLVILFEQPILLITH
jgi:hypothetical protein